MLSLQDEAELEQLLQVDGRARDVVRDMRQKVEEAKSSLSSNRSRGKVLDALMQQKKSGKIPGILGRLVGPHSVFLYTCSLHSDMSNLLICGPLGLYIGLESQ